MKLEIKKSELLKKMDVISVGYCKLQCLFRLADINRIYYTTSQYGWGSDILPTTRTNLVISSGYKPLTNISKNKQEKIDKLTTLIEKRANVIDNKNYNDDYYTNLKMRKAQGKRLFNYMIKRIESILYEVK